MVIGHYIVVFAKGFDQVAQNLEIEREIGEKAFVLEHLSRERTEVFIRILKDLEAEIKNLLEI